jgi:hypothetical protein
MHAPEAEQRERPEKPKFVASSELIKTVFFTPTLF